MVGTQVKFLTVVFRSDFGGVAGAVAATDNFKLGVPSDAIFGVLRSASKLAI